MAEIEATMSSCERIKFYTEHLVQEEVGGEGVYISMYLIIYQSIFLSIYMLIYLSNHLSIYISISLLDFDKLIDPPSDWPSRGVITFNKASMRYREGIYLSIYLSLYLSNYISNYISNFLSIYLSI
jgi:hypothetical protein